MNHKQFFTVLFTLFITLFTFSACDDGGGDNNNNLTVDQDVSDWCAEWLYCSEDARGYEYIPYETQEGCEQSMQWVKDHKDNEPEYMACYPDTLGNHMTLFECGDIDSTWSKGGDCSYTPYGLCAESREGGCEIH